MTEKRQPTEMPVPVQGMPVMYYPPEDEIDLADLWRVLVRRRGILLVVFLTIAALSLAFAFVTPKKYYYRASVEIGSVPTENDLQLIEDPSTTLAKLKEAYIPRAVAELVRRRPEYEHKVDLEARIPKKSQLVVVEGKGTEEDQEVYLGLIQGVLNALFDDHRRVLEIAKTRLDAELQARRAKIAELQDQHRNLTAELKRMDDLDRLLQTEIDQLRRRLQEAQRRYQQIARLKDPASVMTMLMIQNQIQADDERLRALEERLLIGQKNKREQLRKQIADTDRAIEIQKLKVKEVENQIKNLRMTRAIVPPMRSVEPAGPARRVIVALGLVLGLVLGVMAAFFAEFVAKASQKEEAASG